MTMRPLLRYAALYAAVEVAAMILLAWTIGLGWTLATLAATFMVGVVLAASQLKGQVGRSGGLGPIRRARRPTASWWGWGRFWCSCRAWSAPPRAR